MSNPYACGFDSNGNILILDGGNSRIRILYYNQTAGSASINTFAGGYPDTIDNIDTIVAATATRFYQPMGMWVSSSNNDVFVADSYNNQYFSADWIREMLNLEKNDIRKYKINRIFNDEAGKI